MFIKKIVFLFTLLLLSGHAIASDLEKEKRWEEQISDSILDGEAIKLHDGKSNFLAIDTRAEEPKDVGVIILHGVGIHPDWPTVIQPLRVGLAAEGWNTLSLQMPILANGATPIDYKPLMKEVPARIDAGIRYLFKEGAKKVVIVGHSLGAQMANYYLAHKKLYKEAQTETPIIAYVGIGMGSGNTQYLKKIKLPVLDLYGEKDLPDVLDAASKRKIASANNKKYWQRKVDGANHFFEGKEEELVKAVKGVLLGFNFK